LSFRVFWKLACIQWNVGRSSISKIKKLRRDTGCIEPRKGVTGSKPKLLAHRQRLQEIVAKTPDATLEEIRAQLPVPVSIQTVHVELKKLKLTYKKKSSRCRTRASWCCRKTSGVESPHAWFSILWLL